MGVNPAWAPPGQKVESTNAKRILSPSFCFEVVALGMEGQEESRAAI